MLLVHSTYNLFERERKVDQSGKPVDAGEKGKDFHSRIARGQLILENLLGISLDGDKTTAARKIHQNGIRFHHGRADDDDDGRDHCCRLTQDMPRDDYELTDR